MLTKFSVVTISGLAVVGLLTGCSGAIQESTKYVEPSPSATAAPEESETPSQTDPNPEPDKPMDYDAEIVLANNELELEFLTIALNSCEKTQQVGFVIDQTEGVSIFRPAESGSFPDWPFDQVSVVGGKPGFGEYDDLFYNSLPLIFAPCSLERAARIRGDATEVRFEHKVTKRSDNTYTWAQHQGGANLDEYLFEVKDGFITAYGWENKLLSKVSYGPLTAKQNELLDQDLIQ